jgi:hypothetical protein
MKQYEELSESEHDRAQGVPMNKINSEAKKYKTVDEHGGVLWDDLTEEDKARSRANTRKAGIQVGTIIGEAIVAKLREVGFE